MTAAAAGDRAAFVRYYDGASAMVYGLAKRILRAPAIAEEVTQEVFLEVWQKASDWAPHRSSAITWTLLLTRRRAIDRVRSEQASRNRQESVGPALSFDTSSPPEDEIERREDEQQVRAALSELSEKQRAVIDLAYYQGRTYVEVAEILDLPLGTVKTRMGDALIRMRELYGVGR